jgi:hypothetical protein
MTPMGSNKGSHRGLFGLAYRADTRKPIFCAAKYAASFLEQPYPSRRLYRRTVDDKSLAWVGEIIDAAVVRDARR